MRRRGYLALVGACFGGLSGCSGDSSNVSSPTPTESRTLTPRNRRVSVGRTVTLGDARLTVKNPRVTKAVIVDGIHSFVEAHSGQYVVVDVEIDDGTQYSVDQDGGRPSLDGEVLPGKEPITDLSEDDRYAFPFPITRSETAALQWTLEESTVEWELPESVRERLAVAPEFHVEELGVNGHNGQRQLDIAVANEGNRDGLFVARVSIEGFSGGQIVEFPVPSGESKRYTGEAGGIVRQLANNSGGHLTVQYPAPQGLVGIEHRVDTAETPI